MQTVEETIKKNGKGVFTEMRKRELEPKITTTNAIVKVLSELAPVLLLFPLYVLAAF